MMQKTPLLSSNKMNDEDKHKEIILTIQNCAGVFFGYQ